MCAHLAFSAPRRVHACARARSHSLTAALRRMEGCRCTLP